MTGDPASAPPRPLAMSGHPDHPRMVVVPVMMMTDDDHHGRVGRRGEGPENRGPKEEGQDEFLHDKGY